jgi:hypothetical protein
MFLKIKHTENMEKSENIIEKEKYRISSFWVLGMTPAQIATDFGVRLPRMHQ